MGVLSKIAFYLDRRDDIPNQELAKELADAKNIEGIKEIADNMWNENKFIQGDCIKVMYEIGYIEPALIVDYTGEFIKLLSHRNNRMIWGAMIALAITAEYKADFIFENIMAIYDAMKDGSVITIDNGIKVLAAVAAKNSEYSKEIFPYLMQHLRKCRLKEIIQHAESVLKAVNESNIGEYLEVIKEMEPQLSTSQMTRIKKIYKKLGVEE